MPRKYKTELPPLEVLEKPIGLRIANQRKKLGLTQSDLAKEIGVNRSLISEYECGRLQIRAEMLVRFAMALNVNVDSLLGIQTSKAEDDSPNLRIMKRLRKIENLTPMKQKVLLRMIDGYLKENDL